MQRITKVCDTYPYIFIFREYYILDIYRTHRRIDSERVNDQVEPAASIPTDAPDGKLGDAFYAGLTAVRNASSALLNGLELGGCVGGASSASGTQLGKPARDPRSIRKSTASSSASAGALEALQPSEPKRNKRGRVERAKAPKRDVSKSQLAVDGEVIDCSDDE